MLKYQKPDYERWIKKDVWILKEAVQLLYGCEPGDYDRIDHLMYPSDITSRMEEVYDLVERATFIKQLKFPDWYDGPTMEGCIFPSEFLRWAKHKDLPIPDELKVLLKSEEAPVEENLRPNQEDKRNVQAIALETWKNYEVLDIKHMKELPAIKNIVGRQYKQKTLHNWLSEVAPDRAKKAGKRKPETRAKQEAACQKLGIRL